MIVVSGEPRSGTSLMMLVLKKLGLDVEGDKFISDYTKKLNPSGIWEVKGVPYKALTKELIEHYDITGEAIKVVSHMLFQSDLTLVDKLIWMLRDPREIIVSQRKQKGWKDDETQWAWYIIHSHLLSERMRLGTWNVDMIFVNYKDLIKRPRKEIRRICEFLQIPYRGKASKAINKKYYRSRAKLVEDNPRARAFYDYFNSMGEICY